MTKRRDGEPMCISRNCRRVRYEDRLCVIHYADRVWSDAVKERDGFCRGALYRPQLVCLGRLEADHLIGRSYGATRWLLDVGTALCLAHHKFFTEHPLEHVDLAVEVMGEREYEARRRLALTHIPDDPEAAIARLRLEVSA